MYIHRQWLENEANSIYTDEAHSNGTVQDFHLIPFSSVSPHGGEFGTRLCKGRENIRKSKITDVEIEGFFKW